MLRSLLAKLRRTQLDPPSEPTGTTTDRDDPALRQSKPNGQQERYLVLSADERARGFVRPVRTSYVHQVCGAVTRMSTNIAETYARDPEFYGSTFCVGCGKHYPVGLRGEFLWDGTIEKVGT